MTRRRVYLLIQSILCILLCLLLSLTVIRIYLEGMQLREAGDYLTWVYTREKVSERLGPLLPLFLGSAVFMIAGLVLGIKDERSDKPVPDAQLLRDLSSRKVRVPTPQMSREREKQKRLRITGCALACACAVPVCLYLGNTAHFEGSSGEMVEQAFQEMLFHIVPWIAIAFGCLCITETLREKSMGREAKMAADAGKAQREMVRASYADAAKASAVSGDKAAPGAAPNADKARDVSCEKHTVQNAVRAVVLAAAVIFLIHGIMNGSMQDVLVKAVNICTECIGLG